jgi:hypothetical protein
MHSPFLIYTSKSAEPWSIVGHGSARLIGPAHLCLDVRAVYLW